MIKNKVGVAVAGLGFIGRQTHVPAFKKIPNAELIAVIDIIEDLAKEVASEHNIKYYLDYKEALKNPDIDAMVVATPTRFHFNLVSEALANGKHVFCEIPLTPDVNESKQLIEIANESRVILMPDLTFRFTPNYAKAKELIDEFAIGKPISLNFCELIPAKDLATQSPSDSWARNTKKSSGYPDFSLSILSLDLVRWLFDSEIIDAKWMSNNVQLPGLNDYAVYNTAVIIRLSNNAIGILHYSASILTEEGTARLEIFGDNTSVLRATWNDHISLVDEKFQTEWTFKMRGTKVWGHYQIDSHFIDCILQGKKPLATVEDAIKAQIIAEKINQ